MEIIQVLTPIKPIRRQIPATGKRATTRRGPRHDHSRRDEGSRSEV